MKFPLFAVLVSLALLTACQEEKRTPLQEGAQSPHPSMPDHGMVTGNGEKRYGTVVETFDAGGFTYVKLDNGRETFWAAGPLTTLTPGAMVAIFTGMPMEDYHSKSLDRTFELIYFTEKIITDSHKAGADAPVDEPDPHAGITRAADDAPVAGIEALDDGETIASIRAKKDSLAGQKVRVRGKVVKYTRAVMGRNWLHIRDGSSGEDLTVTTSDSAALGDVIVVEGTLAANRDFGYGYVYELILEDATVTRE